MSSVIRMESQEADVRSHSPPPLRRIRSRSRSPLQRVRPRSRSPLLRVLHRSRSQKVKVSEANHADGGCPDEQDLKQFSKVPTWTCRGTDEAFLGLDFAGDLAEDANRQQLEDLLAKIRNHLVQLRRAHLDSSDENQHEQKLTEIEEKNNTLQVKRDEVQCRVRTQQRDKQNLVRLLEDLTSRKKQLLLEKKDDEIASACLKRRAEKRRREQEEDEKLEIDISLRADTRKDKSKEHAEQEAFLGTKMRDLQREEELGTIALNDIDKQVQECKVLRQQLVERAKKIRILSHQETLCCERLADVTRLEEEALTLAESEETMQHLPQLDDISDDPLKSWLTSLDGGRGSMLCYLDSVRQEFEHLEALRASFMETSTTGGVLGHIDPFVWEAIGVDRHGHRLLIAKGIIALCQGKICFPTRRG